MKPHSSTPEFARGKLTLFSQVPSGHWSPRFHRNKLKGGLDANSPPKRGGEFTFTFAPFHVLKWQNVQLIPIELNESDEWWHAMGKILRFFFFFLIENFVTCASMSWVFLDYKTLRFSLLLFLLSAGSTMSCVLPWWVTQLIWATRMTTWERKHQYWRSWLMAHTPSAR